MGSSGPISKSSEVESPRRVPWLLRSDNDPEPDERITVTGQRIGQRVRQRCQEPKNDFLASMCPKWVPHTLSASQIRTYDERVRNPTRALMAAGTPVFSTSRGPSFSDHFYPARRGIDCGPRRSTEVVLNEQPLPEASMKSSRSEDATSTTRAWFKSWVFQVTVRIVPVPRRWRFFLSPDR